MNQTQWDQQRHLLRVNNISLDSLRFLNCVSFMFLMLQCCILPLDFWRKYWQPPPNTQHLPSLHRSTKHSCRASTVAPDNCHESAAAGLSLCETHPRCVSDTKRLYNFIFLIKCPLNLSFSLCSEFIVSGDTGGSAYTAHTQWHDETSALSGWSWYGFKNVH